MFTQEKKANDDDDDTNSFDLVRPWKGPQGPQFENHPFSLIRIYKLVHTVTFPEGENSGKKGVLVA